MRRIRALKRIVRHVPGQGMVVGNPASEEVRRGDKVIRKARKADIVSVPAEIARKLVDEGRGEYADPHGDNEGDVPARPKTRREKTLAARAARRAAKSEAVADTVQQDPELGDGSEAEDRDEGDEPVPTPADVVADTVQATPTRRGRKAPANTDAPVD